MSTTDNSDTRAEWVAGLRELADFVEAHPDVVLPSAMRGHAMRWSNSSDNAEHLARQARILSPVSKTSDNGYIGIERKFGPHVFRVEVSQEGVCERVQVGTETVTRYLPPEGVELVTVVDEVPVYEWRCPDSILAAAQDIDHARERAREAAEVDEQYADVGA